MGIGPRPQPQGRVVLQHLMNANGKFSNITHVDLLQGAYRFGVRRAGKLARVCGRGGVVEKDSGGDCGGCLRWFEPDNYYPMWV